MSDTSIPEDDTASDGVDAPITDDTDAPEPTENQRRYAFLSRHISALRALRLGGVFTVLTAIVLAIVWWVQLTLLWRGVPPYFLFTLAIVFLWFVGVRLRPLKRTLAAITAVCTIVAVGVMGQYWWLIHEQTFNWSELFQALLISGLGVFIVSDVLLRGIRDHQNIPPSDPDDPARYRPRKHNNTTSSRRWISLLRRAALALAPVTAAATAIALLQASAAPINHTAPLPEGPLPERSTGIGTTLSWTKDVTGLLATTSGAAGPVILTVDGLTGLNPTDGTTLWTYQRTNATYAKILTQNLRREDFSNSLLNSYLVSSPNGRYVALRIEIPKELVQDPKDLPPTENSEKRKPINNAVTVVVDTLTGRVTTEHPSNINWSLQLTDSAILDGATAYNLDDGKVRWQLEPLVTNDSETHLHTAYSGPAGHSSFIRLGKFPKSQSIYYEKPKCTSESLILISDTDPNNTTTAENIANDVLTCRPVIVNGLTAQYKKALVVELKESGSIQAMQAQETRVVTLDSLAGLEEVNPVDMGKSVGLNVAASHASGTLAAYPVPEDGKIKFYTDSITDFYRGTPTVGTVFDPTVNTATPAGQYPGLAAATVGIALAARDETLLAEVVMKPSYGSAGASFPLDSQGIPQPPEEILANRRLIPAQLSELKEGRDVNAINTPGTTLVTLKIDDLEPFHSSGRYKPTDSHRLYGLTGDVS